MVYTLNPRKNIKMSRKIIEFDASAKTGILEFFNKTIDRDNYIVEKDNPSQRILADDGEEISIDKFAGITKGSDIFIKSDLPSLIRLSDRLR